MIVTEIGKVQNDKITVRVYDGEDLTSVGIHYAGTIRQGCEYLLPPDKARELIAQSGYNGEEIELLVPNGRYLMDYDVGPVVAGMLQAVGLNVQVNVLEWSAYIGKFNSGDFNGMALIAYGDDFFDASYGMNEYRTENCTPISCYSTEEYDQLYLDALNNMDPESRAEQLVQMQEMIFVDECVQAPFIHLKVPYGINSNLDFHSRIDEQFKVNRIFLK